MAANKAPRKKSLFEKLKEAHNEEFIDLPGIKEKVIARGPAAATMRAIYELSLKDGKKIEDTDAFDEKKLEALTIAATIVDANGSALFTEDEAGRLEELQPGLYTKIVSAVNRVNGLLQESVGNG